MSINVVANQRKSLHLLYYTSTRGVIAARAAARQIVGIHAHPKADRAFGCFSRLPGVGTVDFVVVVVAAATATAAVHR